MKGIGVHGVERRFLIYFIGRRYLRFFKFIEHFDRALRLLARPLKADATGSTAAASKSLILTSIEFGKWSCLGLYFLLEDLTIVSLSRF